MKLTATNVEETFKDCLWRDEDIQGVAIETLKSLSVVVEGVMFATALCPARLETHRADIESMLSELPDTFKDGMSFLNACYTKSGEQWGEHRQMDLLFVLGQAIGKVEMCAPRSMWSILPGGMPYFKVAA